MEHFGDYILLERINSGGMAHIYKGAKLGSSGFFKLLAVKRIKEKVAQDAGFQEMFIKEAHVQSSFAHPNVVNIFDFGQEKGNYFIAMEYLNGVPLRTLLDMLRFRHEQLQLEQVLYIIDSLLKGLNYIHNMVSPDGTTMTIIHRDIDPQNVFLTYSGEIKLIDFGIAGSEVDIEGKDDASLKGKYSYFAPELLNGHQADQRTDLFSAGLLLYEMLTLHKFFAAETGEQVLDVISSLDIEHKINALPVDDDLKQILCRTLAREPDQRYPSASEFSYDLSLYQQDHKIRVSSSLFSSIMDHLFQKEQQEELKKNQFFFSILKDRDMAEGDHTSIIKTADLQREIQAAPDPVNPVDPVKPVKPIEKAAESMAAVTEVTGRKAVTKEIVRMFLIKNKKPVSIAVAACCLVFVLTFLLPKKEVNVVGEPPLSAAKSEQEGTLTELETTVIDGEVGLIGSEDVEILEVYDDNDLPRKNTLEQGQAVDSKNRDGTTKKPQDNDSRMETGTAPELQTAGQTGEETEEVEDVVPEQDIIQARIEIQGKPEGQVVFLDGVELGELPISIQARPGFHSIECRKNGFWTQTLRVRALDEQSVTVECNLLPNKNTDKKNDTSQPAEETGQ